MVVRDTVVPLAVHLAHREKLVEPQFAKMYLEINLIAALIDY